MIDFIVKNKEWLFSGVGVFLVAGAISLFKLLIAKKRRAPSKPFLEAHGLSGSATDNSLYGVNVVPSERISPDEIREAYTRVPLLQRSDVARHYHGLRVRWEGKVFSVQPVSEGQVKIEIKWQNTVYGIFFTVDSSKYDGLGVLRRGDVLVVDGRVDEVSEFYSSLSDAVIVTDTTDPKKGT